MTNGRVSLPDDCPILICLLGNFRLLKLGTPVPLRNAWKSEALLCYLALEPKHCVARDRLLAALWPEIEPQLAGQSLNSLVYSLRKLLGDCLAGESPVLHQSGYYRLNLEAGIGLDTEHFDRLVEAGNKQVHLGNPAAAMVLYESAANLYQGDLQTSSDIHTVIERERLRARYLTLLAQLADYYFTARDYSTCLKYAHQLLIFDPSREDAYRLGMRCHVRRGERAQAFREYLVCSEILRREFDATPEPETTALFARIRLDPGSI